VGPTQPSFIAFCSRIAEGIHEPPACGWICLKFLKFVASVAFEQGTDDIEERTGTFLHSTFHNHEIFSLVQRRVAQPYSGQGKYENPATKKYFNA
jgi:hypothetical protein